MYIRVDSYTILGDHSCQMTSHLAVSFVSGARRFVNASVLSEYTACCLGTDLAFVCAMYPVYPIHPPACLGDGIM